MINVNPHISPAQDLSHVAGLVAAWNGVFNDDGTLKDVSGNGYNLSLVGGTLPVKTGIRFNGSTSYCRKAVTAFRSGDAQGTFECIISKDSLSSGIVTIFGSNSESSASYLFDIRFYGEYFYIRTRENGTWLSSALVAVPSTLAGVPIHLVVTSNGSVYKFYANGEDLGAITGDDNGVWFSSVSHRVNIILGAYVSSSVNYLMDGILSFAAVYSDCKDLAWVRSRYNDFASTPALTINFQDETADASNKQIPRGMQSDGTLDGYIKEDAYGEKYFECDTAGIIKVPGVDVNFLEKSGFIGSCKGSLRTLNENSFIQYSDRISLLSNKIEISLKNLEKLDSLAIWTNKPSYRSELSLLTDIFGTDIALWLEYDRNVVKDGSNNLSAIGDMSINGLAVTQTTGANQPVWSTSGIVFNSTTSFLDVNGNGTAGKYTYIFVLSSTETGANDRCQIIGHSTATHLTGGFAFNWLDASPGWYNRYVAPGDANYVYWANANLNDGNFHNFEVYCDASEQAGIANNKLRKNGVLIDYLVGTPVLTGVANAWSNLMIGRGGDRYGGFTLKCFGIVND